MRSAESWQPIVDALGYANEHAMLDDLYTKQAMSVEELAKKLGYSRGIIRNHIIHAKIPLRSRGGPNRNVTSKLADVPDSDFLTLGVHKLASDLGMHYSTVYKEARRRGLQCSSVLSPQPENSSDTPDVPLPNSVSRSSPGAAIPIPGLTLSGIEEELLQEIESSLTTEPTSPPASTPTSTCDSPTNSSQQS